MKRAPRILLLEPNPHVTDMIVEGLMRRLAFHVTCVTQVEEALYMDLIEPQDVVIAAVQAGDVDSPSWVRRLTLIPERPVLLIAGRVGAKTVIAWMRLGVRDVFVKPFPLRNLLDSVEQALRTYRRRCAREARHDQVRRLIRRLLRDRRHLQARMNFACEEMVVAQKRLFEKVSGASDRASRSA